MLLRRLVVAIFFIGVMGLDACVASAQDYPNKPVRIVTAGLGGGTDFVARLIAQGISGSIGQPVIIDNRSGVITGEIVAKAPPDGYTLLVIGQAHWIGPLMQQAPYDAIKDYSPITIADRSPSVVVVHPSLPVKLSGTILAASRRWLRERLCTVR